MLTNTERQQIVEEVNAGTYGIDEALDDIAAAQKGEEVRKALYAEALVLNREGHAGSTDMIARQQIANLQTSVNGQISTLRTEVGDDIDDLETALNSGLATQNGKIAAQNATIANVVKNYNLEYGSEALWEATGETGLLASGTTATLSKDVSNFDYVDIYSFCGNSNVLDTVPVDAKLQSSQGYALRWVNLSDPDSGSYKAYVRIIETRLHIIGTTLTIDHQVTYRNGEEVNISGAEITQSNRSTYMGELGIMKIVGRKITANTEIEDVRIGADGTEYNSAGQAVRAQVTALESAIPAVDSTLSMQGAAADAEVAGDKVAELKSAFKNSTVVYDVIKNKYINSSDGAIKSYNEWDMTDYIPVMDRMLIYSPERNIYCWWYKSDKSPLSQQILSAGMNEYNPPENAAYIAISNSRSVIGNTLVYNGAYIQNKHSADYVKILDNGVHFEETMNTTEGVALSTSLYPQGIIANVDYVVKYINSWGGDRSVYGLTLFGEGGMTQQYEAITVFEPKTINVPFDVVKVDVYVASNVTGTGTVTLTIDKNGISDIEDAPQPFPSETTDVDITTLGDALIYRKISPSYYFDLVGTGTSAVGEYLANKANSIKNDGVRFGFYTDSHYPRSVHDAEEIINYIRFRTNIKHIINGGDYIDKYPSKYTAMADMSKCVNPMISAFGHDFIPVLGDHDNNTYGWSTAEELENAMIPYTEISKRLHAGLPLNAVMYNPIERMETMSFYNSANRNEWIAYFGNNYYVDDDTEKVRYIISNTGNVDGIQKTIFNLSTPSEIKLAIPWLYNAIMSVPNGYSIVYACHRIVSQPNIQWLPAVACGMIGAAKVKNNAYRIPKTPANENLTEWFGNTAPWIFDFSNAPTIDKVIAVSGHTHEDFVVVVNGNDGSYDFWDGTSAINISGGYVPVVITQTDSFGAYDDGTTSPHTMTQDTVTEHCVDFIQIGDESINITRIGAGNDRTIPII